MQDGLTLLIVGMGTVFAFLVLLVVAMSASSALIVRFFPEPPTEEISPSSLNEIAIAVAAAHARFSE